MSGSFNVVWWKTRAQVHWKVYHQASERYFGSMVYWDVYWRVEGRVSDRRMESRVFEEING